MPLMTQALYGPANEDREPREAICPKYWQLRAAGRPEHGVWQRAELLRLATRRLMTGPPRSSATREGATRGCPPSKEQRLSDAFLIFGIARVDARCQAADPAASKNFGRGPILASENADADYLICAALAVEAMAMPTRITARPIALRTDIGSRNKIFPPRLTKTKTKPTITG